MTLPSDPLRTIVVGVVDDENIKSLNYVDPHGAIGIIESIDFQGTLIGADASGHVITEYSIELNDEAIDGGGS